MVTFAEASRLQPVCLLAGFDAEGADGVAERAFASGLATIQRKQMSGPHAKYRVQHLPLFRRSRSIWDGWSRFAPRQLNFIRTLHWNLSTCKIPSAAWE